MWKLGTRRPQPSAEKSPTGPLQVSIAKLEWPPCVKSGNCQSLEGFTWFPWISCNSGFLKISLGKLVPLWLDRYGPRNQKNKGNPSLHVFIYLRIFRHFDHLSFQNVHALKSYLFYHVHCFMNLHCACLMMGVWGQKHSPTLHGIFVESVWSKFLRVFAACLFC